MARQKARLELKRTNPNTHDFLPTVLEKNVEVIRSTVLNKLSHTGSSGLVQTEVADAIKIVEQVIAHKFPNLK